MSQRTILVTALLIGLTTSCRAQSPLVRQTQPSALLLQTEPSPLIRQTEPSPLVRQTESATIDRRARFQGLQTRLQAARAVPSVYPNRYDDLATQRLQRAAEYRLQQDRREAAARASVNAAAARANYLANQQVLRGLSRENELYRRDLRDRSLSARQPYDTYSSRYPSPAWTTREPTRWEYRWSAPPTYESRPEIESSFDQAEPIADVDEPTDADALYADARRAYDEANYPRALELIDDAIYQRPGDSAFHQFRSQVLVAIRNTPTYGQVRRAPSQMVRVPVVTEEGAIVATRVIAEPALEDPLDPLVQMPPLPGTWRATDGKGTYLLTLGADNEFLWRYPNDTIPPLRGIYVMDENRIVFETDDGTAMVGTFAAAPEGLGLRVTGSGGAFLHFLK